MCIRAGLFRILRQLDRCGGMRIRRKSQEIKNSPYITPIRPVWWDENTEKTARNQKSSVKRKEFADREYNELLEVSLFSESEPEARIQPPRRGLPLIGSGGNAKMRVSTGMVKCSVLIIFTVGIDHRAFPPGSVKGGESLVQISAHAFVAYTKLGNRACAVKQQFNSSKAFHFFKNRGVYVCHQDPGEGCSEK